MANSKPYEIIIAPYEVWLAPVGESFPAIEDTPAGNWAKLGTNGKRNQSEDGVTVTHEQTIYEHRNAGHTGPAKFARTEENQLISFVLEDLTLEQYAKLINGPTVDDTPAGGGAAGYRDITLWQGPDVQEYAMLVRGPSPYGSDWNMQYQVPIVVQTDNPAPVFQKGGAAGLACEWRAKEDPDAATEKERFGKLRGQDADPAA